MEFFMRNYFLFSLSALFLVACGGSGEDAAASKTAQPAEPVISDTVKNEVADFFNDVKSRCKNLGDQMGLTFMFQMMGVDYVEVCECQLDEASKLETYADYINDPEAFQSRIMARLGQATEICQKKFGL